MRVVRLLVYNGPEEWVINTIKKSISGEKEIYGSHGDVATITAITLGTFPDDLQMLINKEVKK